MNKKNVFVSLGILFICVFIISISSTMVTNAKEESSAPGKYKYYTSICIEKGDSLWSIAEEYAYDGISTVDYIDELKRINSLEGDDIKAGCYLLVSYYSDEYIE